MESWSFLFFWLLFFLYVQWHPIYLGLITGNFLILKGSMLNSFFWRETIHPQVAWDQHRTLILVNGKITNMIVSCSFLGEHGQGITINCCLYVDALGWSLLHLPLNTHRIVEELQMLSHKGHFSSFSCTEISVLHTDMLLSPFTLEWASHIGMCFLVSRCLQSISINLTDINLNTN